MRPIIKSSSFSLHFIPEASGVEASIIPNVGSRYTGETKSREFINEQNVTDFIVQPHTRGRDLTKKETVPDFYLMIPSSAKHICSLPRSARLEILLYRVYTSGSLPKTVNDGLILIPPPRINNEKRFCY